MHLFIQELLYVVVKLWEGEGGGSATIPSVPQAVVAAPSFFDPGVLATTEVEFEGLAGPTCKIFWRSSGLGMATPP